MSHSSFFSASVISPKSTRDVSIRGKGMRDLAASMTKLLSLSEPVSMRVSLMRCTNSSPERLI